MNKIITYFSVGTAAFALAYGFDQNIFLASFVCIGCIVLTSIGFGIEAYIKVNGNRILNKLVFYFTKNDKEYNILHKHITYSYLGNDKYSFKKTYDIWPTISDLDRFSDRFSWSAPSLGCVISPTQQKHTISSRRQQEMWTCYAICFNELCAKHKSYSVGSEISNLVDETHVVVPFLSNTIDRKTKCTTLEVKFPQNKHPETAKFEIFSSKAWNGSICEEILTYDQDIGGFKKTIPFPRKGWRYVISWQ